MYIQNFKKKLPSELIDLEKWDLLYAIYLRSLSSIVDTTLKCRAFGRSQLKKIRACKIISAKATMI